MHKPELRLSVIITCFNYERFVGRAIESVRRQCEARCELIVVDDGSTDASWAVVQSYALDCALQVPNGGAARAAREALRHARAPFVLFLDADDELAPGSLARIIPQLDSGVAKLQFALTPINEGGRTLGAPLPRFVDGRERARFQRQVLRTGAYPSPPTSGNVFRRDVCDLLSEVDYEMSVDGVTLFAAPFFGDIVTLSAALGFYRLHRRNYSQSGSRPTAARFKHEADRFALRHDHLRRILAQRGIDSVLPDASRMFFYRERRLYQHLLEGVRPTFGETVALQWHVLRSRVAGTDRLLLWIFLAGCLLMPRRFWPALLTRRFRPRRRRLRLGLGRQPTAATLPSI